MLGNPFVTVFLLCIVVGGFVFLAFTAQHKKDKEFRERLLSKYKDMCKHAYLTGIPEERIKEIVTQNGGVKLYEFCNLMDEIRDEVKQELKTSNEH